MGRKMEKICFLTTELPYMYLSKEWLKWKVPTAWLLLPSLIKISKTCIKCILKMKIIEEKMLRACFSFCSCKKCVLRKILKMYCSLTS